MRIPGGSLKTHKIEHDLQLIVNVVSRRTDEKSEAMERKC
jgi:hypothetical protein